MAIRVNFVEGEDWSSEFFGQLSAIDKATARVVDEMLTAVRARRKSKEPYRL